MHDLLNVTLDWIRKTLNVDDIGARLFCSNCLKRCVNRSLKPLINTVLLGLFASKKNFLWIQQEDTTHLIKMGFQMTDSSIKTLTVQKHYGCQCVLVSYKKATEIMNLLVPLYARWRHTLACAARLALCDLLQYSRKWVTFLISQKPHKRLSPAVLHWLYFLWNACTRNYSGVSSRSSVVASICMEDDTTLPRWTRQRAAEYNKYTIYISERESQARLTDQ